MLRMLDAETTITRAVRSLDLGHDVEHFVVRFIADGMDGELQSASVRLRHPVPKLRQRRDGEAACVGRSSYGF